MRTDVASAAATHARRFSELSDESVTSGKLLRCDALS
jgi:hypothetical protein